MEIEGGGVKLTPPRLSWDPGTSALIWLNKPFLLSNKIINEYIGQHFAILGWILILNNI